MAELLSGINTFPKYTFFFFYFKYFSLLLGCALKMLKNTPKAGCEDVSADGRAQC